MTSYTSQKIYKFSIIVIRELRSDKHDKKLSVWKGSLFNLVIETPKSLCMLKFWYTPFYDVILAIFVQNQVRDEYRTDFDGGRGGYGMIVKQKLEIPETFG